METPRMVKLWRHTLLHFDEPGISMYRDRTKWPRNDEHDGALVLGEGDIRAVEFLK